MTITLGSLFDGIGVFPLAASRHGITPVWASEIIPDAISITKRHFPEMVHLGDITKLDGGKIPAVHVITFGSHCQNLSSIGPRDGLLGAKSSLFYQAIRIIEEMRDASGGLYPAIAVWENVVGAMLISILSLSGCHKEPSTPKALVPSIMYNGEIYCSTGKQMPGEVAEDAIIGEITSTVPLSQWPEEDGQANFDILGAAYANTSDGLVAFIDNEWTLFEKREISE